MTTTVKTKTLGYTDEEGRRFGSKAEANFYHACEARQARGEIRNLRRLVRLSLIINGVQVGVYTPDALYEEEDYVAHHSDEWKGSVGFFEWVPRVVEVKGYVTREWPFRRKVIEACLGTPLTLVPAKDWSDAAVNRRARQQAQEAMAL